MSDTIPIRGRFAVMPTRGNRFAVLSRAIQAILPQIEQMVVIDNADKPSIIPSSLDNARVTVVHDPEQPPNLSRLWNVGLDMVQRWAALLGLEQWDVAVLNDDAIVPPRWMDTLARQMRELGCAAAGLGPGSLVVHHKPGVTPLAQRLPGFAFILAGEHKVRADQNMRWWCGDNDIDMQSRRFGGTLIAPGAIEHLHPDESTTGVLAEQAAQDMKTFVDKWGFRPW